MAIQVLVRQALVLLLISTVSLCSSSSNFTVRSLSSSTGASHPVNTKSVNEFRKKAIQLRNNRKNDLHTTVAAHIEVNPSSTLTGNKNSSSISRTEKFSAPFSASTNGFRPLQSLAQPTRLLNAYPSDRQASNRLHFSRPSINNFRYSLSESRPSSQVFTRRQREYNDGSVDASAPSNAHHDESEAEPSSFNSASSGHDEADESEDSFRSSEGSHAHHEPHGSSSGPSNHGPEDSHSGYDFGPGDDDSNHSPREHPPGGIEDDHGMPEHDGMRPPTYLNGGGPPPPFGPPMAAGPLRLPPRMFPIGPPPPFAHIHGHRPPPPPMFGPPPSTFKSMGPPPPPMMGGRSPFNSFAIPSASGLSPVHPASFSSGPRYRSVSRPPHPSSSDSGSQSEKPSSFSDDFGSNSGSNSPMFSSFASPTFSFEPFNGGSSSSSASDSFHSNSPEGNSPPLPNPSALTSNPYGASPLSGFGFKANEQLPFLGSPDLLGYSALNHNWYLNQPYMPMMMKQPGMSNVPLNPINPASGAPSSSSGNNNNESSKDSKDKENGKTRNRLRFNLNRLQSIRLNNIKLPSFLAWGSRNSTTTTTPSSNA